MFNALDDIKIGISLDALFKITNFITNGSNFLFIIKKYWEMNCTGHDYLRMDIKKTLKFLQCIKNSLHCSKFNFSQLFKKNNI